MPLPNGAGALRRLTLIGCTAIVLLSAWIQLRVLAGTDVVQPIRADAASYVSYAWNMREYRTFSRARTWQSEAPVAPAPDKLTLPGYPAFLALFLEGKPDQEFIAKATTVQALLGVASCALVLMIALRVLPAPAALAVGMVTAISPHLATISTYLLTESLFTFLLAAFVYAAVRAVQAPARLPWYLASAGLLAVASYIRPQLEVLPVVLLMALPASPAVRKHWKNAVAAIALFLALMAPWQWRNAGVERPVGEPDLLATTLYHGSFPDFMYRGNPQSRGIPYRFDPLAREHSESLQGAVGWIRSEFRRDPAGMTWWYLFGKPCSFMSWNIVAGFGDIFIYPISRSPFVEGGALVSVRALARLLHAPLMILGFAAALAGALRPRLLAPRADASDAVRALSIMLLAIVVVHMIGAPFPRYGIPFRWMSYLLAMLALVRLLPVIVGRPGPASSEQPGGL